MISECVKLTAAFFGTERRVAKFTWELCPCCNFTRIKLLRMKINRMVFDQPPIVFNNLHFTFSPDFGTNFAGMVYPFPPPSISSQVWTEFDELFDLEVGSDSDWYVGPLGPDRGFSVFSINNQDGFILLAQCCETNGWMMSKISIVRFIVSPWTAANKYLIGYSGTNPPP